MTEYTLGVFLVVVVVGVLALDLGVFQRKAHALSMRRAIQWTCFWIGSALVFNVVVYFTLGEKAALSFLAGYLVEESLSVDNLFVFLIIFAYFQVPAAYQHKILFWGIIGAVVFRGVLIYAGIQLIQTYHWLTYIFGAFLIFTGYKTFKKTEEKLEIEKNPVLRLLRRCLPITDGYREGHFLWRENGKLFVTPLFIVLVMIETTDVIFALDSIPAILAITTDPFILYTSNLFAILGLRSLFFVLAGLMSKFKYLSYGVSLVLVFVGLKMILAPWFHVPEGGTLVVIIFLIGGSAYLSVRLDRGNAPEPETLPDAGRQLENHD